MQAAARVPALARARVRMAERAGSAGALEPGLAAAGRRRDPVVAGPSGSTRARCRPRWPGRFELRGRRAAPATPGRRACGRRRPRRRRRARLGRAHRRRPQVVVAAGWRSGELAGLPDDARVPVRPVKGQILRLRGEPRAPIAGRVVRHPRGLRRAATATGAWSWARPSRSAAPTRTVTAGGVFELLRAAYEALPGITELELVEATRRASPGRARQQADHRAGCARRAWSGRPRTGATASCWPPVTAEAVDGDAGG